MESGFLFGVTLIDDALTPQLSQVLERCTQLASRKRLRRKESCFDRQARELVRQRGTVTNLESAQVEFTEEGMVLSDGTDVGAQCFEYPEFFFVAETEALLVPVCGQRAVVLQKKDLREGSMEQLRVFLQERVSYERLETQIK